MILFQNDLEGRFIRRPNRFIVYADTPEGEIRCHCPNPGRLQELLTPGRRVILSRSDNPERKTPFTLEAAYYNSKVIPLYSSKANQVAGNMIIPRLFPEADLVKAEKSVGNSRFDYYIEEQGRKIFLEVKACTLVEEETAMFPDAPTTRGLKHLQELSEISKHIPGAEGHVLFVINHRDAARFIPSLHTDPAFAAGIMELEKNLTIHAVSINASAKGEVTIINDKVPVQLESGHLAVENRGIYWLLIHLKQNTSIKAGALKEKMFPAGWYVYTGSAKQNLRQRTERHTRKGRKTLRWHVDYLINQADSVKAFPIYTAGDLECRSAEEIKQIADESFPGFGCSDCNCSSHLFRFTVNPFELEQWRTLLYHYRHTLFRNP